MNQKIKKILSQEQRLVRIEKDQRVIFVGDTHGDLEVSQKVVEEYLGLGNVLVFLGDYVDRGPFSKENIDFLLRAKVEHPRELILLQGNHEGFPFLKFSPADFWTGLRSGEFHFYAEVFRRLPLVVEVGNILALHGALPDVKNFSEIEKIKLGGEKWQQITWGDFQEKTGGFLGIDPLTARPQFGREWFFRIMKNLGKKILVRSHQFNAPQYMFNKRCLSIFSSSVYGQPRTIAILDARVKTEKASDLNIRTI